MPLICRIWRGSFSHEFSKYNHDGHLFLQKLSSVWRGSIHRKLLDNSLKNGQFPLKFSKFLGRSYLYSRYQDKWYRNCWLQTWRKYIKKVRRGHFSFRNEEFDSSKHNFYQKPSKGFRIRGSIWSNWKCAFKELQIQ